LTIASLVYIDATMEHQLDLRKNKSLISLMRFQQHLDHMHTLLLYTLDATFPVSYMVIALWLANLPILQRS